MHSGSRAVAMAAAAVARDTSLGTAHMGDVAKIADAPSAAPASAKIAKPPPLGAVPLASVGFDDDPLPQQALSLQEMVAEAKTKAKGLQRQSTRKTVRAPTAPRPPVARRPAPASPPPVPPPLPHLRPPPSRRPEGGGA